MEKITAMKASDRRKNMKRNGWNETPVYLAERPCNASNGPPCDEVMEPNDVAKTNV
jgi:hypothetical protein